MANSLANPIEYPNLFPDYDWALKVEKMFMSARDNHVPAHLYPTAKGDLDLNLIELLKAQVAQMQVMEAQAAAMSIASQSPEPEPVHTEDVKVHVEEETFVPASPVKQTPSSPVRTAVPVEVELPEKPQSPVKSTPVSAAISPVKAESPTKAKNDEDQELDDILDEEDKLIANKTSAQIVAPSSAIAAHVEEDNLDLNDLDDDASKGDGKDILENDDNEGFDSGDDW
jgi:hypothetical protein